MTTIKMHEQDALRRARVVSSLEGSVAQGVGWACNAQDARDLLRYVELANETVVALGTATILQHEKAARLERTAEAAVEVASVVAAGKRWPNLPAWVQMGLETFRDEWVERGRDACRRAALQSGRSFPEDTIAMDATLAERRHHVPDFLEEPDGLTGDERRAAWCEGYDSEAGDVVGGA